METLFNLLKSALVIILAMVATVAIVMHSAFEQQIPAPVQNDAVCPPLDGWSAHLVQIGENLTILAEIVGVEPAELVIANLALVKEHVAHLRIGYSTISRRAIPYLFSLTNSW
jgi:hypothetical protein